MADEAEEIWEFIFQILPSMHPLFQQRERERLRGSELLAGVKPRQPPDKKVLW